jgi:hypothetical protein
MCVSRRGCLPFGPHFDTPIGNINDWTLPAPAVCEHATQQFEFEDGLIVTARRWKMTAGLIMQECSYCRWPAHPDFSRDAHRHLQPQSKSGAASWPHPDQDG